MDVRTSATRTVVSHNQFLQIHPVSYEFSADRWVIVFYICLVKGQSRLQKTKDDSTKSMTDFTRSHKAYSWTPGNTFLWRRQIRESGGDPRWATMDFSGISSTGLFQRHPSLFQDGWGWSAQLSDSAAPGPQCRGWLGAGYSSVCQVSLAITSTTNVTIKWLGFHTGKHKPGQMLPVIIQSNCEIQIESIVAKHEYKHELKQNTCLNWRH